MKEKEVQEMGARILEALGMAGKKESLSEKIKEQNTIVNANNARVANVQKEVDADNAVANEKISSLAKELDDVDSALIIALAVLEKEGYKLPIGGKKVGKAISL